eukprot:5334298-Amphidinium_carterae.1
MCTTKLAAGASIGAAQVRQCGQQSVLRGIRGVQRIIPPKNLVCSVHPLLYAVQNTFGTSTTFRHWALCWTVLTSSGKTDGKGAVEAFTTAQQVLQKLLLDDACRMLLVETHAELSKRFTELELVAKITACQQAITDACSTAEAAVKRMWCLHKAYAQ